MKKIRINSRELIRELLRLAILETRDDLAIGSSLIYDYYHNLALPEKQDCPFVSIDLPEEDCEIENSALFDECWKGVVARWTGSMSSYIHKVNPLCMSEYLKEASLEIEVNGKLLIEFEPESRPVWGDGITPETDLERWYWGTQ